MSFRLTNREYLRLGGGRKAVSVEKRKRIRPGFGLDGEKGIERAEMAVEAPPSANRLWQITATGMSHSAEYDGWLETAGWQVRAQVKGKVRGPFQATIIAPDGRGKRDLDNFIKPLLDLLRKHHVTDDDRYCRRVSAEFGDRPDVFVRIERVAGAPA